MEKQGKFIKCPQCGSGGLDMKEYMDEDTLTVEFTCKMCNHAWTDKAVRE